MAGFEDVIQRALEKHQPASPEVREQVYNSARTALVGMLEKAGNMDPENIRDQQHNLEAAIARIESEFTDIEPARQTVDEASFSEPAQTSYNEPLSPFSRIGRRPFAIMLFATIFVVAITIFGWWAYDQELTKPASMRDNSVPNPPKILAEEQAGDKKPENQKTGWITIFEPSDPRSLITEGAVTADLEKDDIGAYIRLKMEEGDNSSSIKLLVEPGVMESIQGKSVTIELKIKAGAGDQQQFAVTCQFRELGDCGRKRFTAGIAADSFVFKTKLKDVSVSEDEKSGFISIDPDVSRKGRPMDLYMVRVSAE